MVNLSREENFVPHVGWLSHEPGDDVGRYLREGWFEFVEQAVFWLHLRPGDVVVDCGAHVGLFTLLASHAVGERGRVIALEPHPVTVALLRGNVQTAGGNAKNVEIIPAAAASTSGMLTLRAGSGSAAPYSSCVIAVCGATNLRVRGVTIDDVLRERSIDNVALLKIDVEGAELDVWRGAAQTAADGRLPLVMVEFTEGNQRAAGQSSVALARAWLDEGYRFHRFNRRTMRMDEVAIDCPIEYENLFAARDVETVNRRLHDAPAQRQRIARDVLKRGEACFHMMQRGSEVEHQQDLVVDMHKRMDDALRQAGELIDARQRMLAYASRLERLFSSPVGRLARTLGLVSPDLVQKVQRDLHGPQPAPRA